MAAAVLVLTTSFKSASLFYLILSGELIDISREETQTVRDIIIKG